MMLVCAAVLLPVLLAGCAEPTISVRPRPPIPEALIWNHPYPNLTVIVEYVEGFRPSATAIQEMIATLEEVTDKESVILVGPTVIPNHPNDPQRAWSTEDLNEIHKKHAREYGRGQGETAYLFVSYLDGIHDNDPEDAEWARGAAIDNDLFLFHEGIRASYADGAVPRVGAENMERHVLTHEMGHALGLVNCGIPMLTERESPGSECHSTEAESVMGPGIEDWKADIDAAAGRENTLAPLRFTVADLRDLEAFREAGREEAARRAARP